MSAGFVQRERCSSQGLALNEIHHGDCRELLPFIDKNSVACSVWSPLYFVGKQYETYLATFDDWKNLIQAVIQLHFDILKPGAFLVINIADILCFNDPDMPKIHAENI